MRGGVFPNLRGLAEWYGRPARNDRGHPQKVAIQESPKLGFIGEDPINMQPSWLTVGVTSEYALALTQEDMVHALGDPLFQKNLHKQQDVSDEGSLADGSRSMGATRDMQPNIDNCLQSISTEIRRKMCR